LVKKTGIFIQGFDLMDLVGTIHIKTKKTQAALLSELEEILQDQQKYAQIRKIVLDSTNDFTRDIIRDLFGDVS
jgi:hypothetical protein